MLDYYFTFLRTEPVGVKTALKSDVWRIWGAKDAKSTCARCLTLFALRFMELFEQLSKE
jgi:hypothetical protein